MYEISQLVAQHEQRNPTYVHGVDILRLVHGLIRGRGVAAARPRTLRVAAAASPRLRPRNYPRRGRGVAATRPRNIRVVAAAASRRPVRGLSASRPRRRRDPSTDDPNASHHLDAPRRYLGSSAMIDPYAETLTTTTELAPDAYYNDFWNYVGWYLAPERNMVC